MFDEQTSALATVAFGEGGFAAKTGLLPGGARSPLVPIHRGRALTNLFGTSPDNSVLTNNPFYCGKVFYFAKMQILPNEPILKTRNTLPANEIRITLRPFGTQNEPNLGQNQTEFNPIQTKKVAAPPAACRSLPAALTPHASRHAPSAYHCQLLPTFLRKKYVSTTPR